MIQSQLYGGPCMIELTYDIYNWILQTQAEKHQKDFTFEHTQFNFYPKYFWEMNFFHRNNSDRLKETNETESRKCFNRIVEKKTETQVRRASEWMLRISHFVCLALSRDFLFALFSAAVTCRLLKQTGFSWNELIVLLMNPGKTKL